MLKALDTPTTTGCNQLHELCVTFDNNPDMVGERRRGLDFLMNVGATFTQLSLKCNGNTVVEERKAGYVLKYPAGGRCGYTD